MIVVTHFDFRGEDVILRKRLKQHMRRELVFCEPSPPWDLVSQMETNPYGLDYLCVLDFEATCEEVNPDDYLHEIIEFPVLLLNLKTLEIVSTCILLHTQYSWNFFCQCLPPACIDEDFILQYFLSYIC